MLQLGLCPGLAQVEVHVEMRGDGRGKLAVDRRAARAAAALATDLLLGVHEALLDPLAVLFVGADGLSVEKLGERGFDVFVDAGELVGIIEVGDAVTVARLRFLHRSWISRGEVGLGRP